MKVDEFLQRLTPLAERLNALLKDPHPGLHTWVDQVHVVTRQIVALWEST